MSLLQGATMMLRSLLSLGNCGNFKMHWLILEIQNGKNSRLCLSFIQAHSPSQNTSFHVDVLNVASDAILPQVQGQQMQDRFLGSCKHLHLPCTLFPLLPSQSFSPWCSRQPLQIERRSHPSWAVFHIPYGMTPHWNLGLFIQTPLQGINPQDPFYCHHSLIISVPPLLFLIIFHKFCFQVSLSPLRSLIHVGCSHTNGMFKEMQSICNFHL